MRNNALQQMDKLIRIQDMLHGDGTGRKAENENGVELNE